MHKMPKGVPVGDRQMKIAVVLERQTFEKICQRALKENKSFSSVTNEVAKIGLFDLDEAGE